MSKSALLLSPCTVWAGPQAEWYDEDRIEATDNEAKQTGIYFHRQADTLAKGGQSEGGLDQKMAAMLQHCSDYIKGPLLSDIENLQSEVAVRICWESDKAELLPNVKDRRYPKTDYVWQNGTADLIGTYWLDDLLYVGDWKTGTTDGAEEQLMSLAYAFCKAKGIQSGALLECLFVNENGVWPKVYNKTWEELCAHAAVMRSVWSSLKYSKQTVPGPQCTALYCPHLAYCKDISGKAMVMAMEAPEGKPQVSLKDVNKYRVTDKPVSDEEAGFTQAIIAAVNRQVKYLTNCNKDRINKKNGRVTYGQYEWSDGNDGFRWRKPKES